jgi:dTDP-glucose 4,6-dehydratase
MVRAYAHTYGIATTISNCTNNYGPFQFAEKLVPLMISNLIRRLPLPIYGDGSNVRDWIHVDDHVDAIWEVLVRGNLGETYNIAGNAERTNLQMVEALIEAVAERTRADVDELRTLVTFVGDRPGHDQRYALDGTKTREQLGIVPARELARGLRLTVDWYLDHPDWLAAVR